MHPYQALASINRLLLFDLGNSLVLEEKAKNLTSLSSLQREDRYPNYFWSLILIKSVSKEKHYFLSKYVFKSQSKELRF